MHDNGNYEEYQFDAKRSKANNVSHDNNLT